MKLCFLLATSVLGKTPHNREDVEKMTEDERKDFDRDILFNSDEVFWKLLGLDLIFVQSSLY